MYMYARMMVLENSPLAENCRGNSALDWPWNSLCRNDGS